MIILIAIFLNKNLLITDLSLSFYENRIFFNNLSIVFTIFCILILINSLNFYDGINGQSCLIFIYCFTYLLLKSDFNYFYITCIILIFIVMAQNLKNMFFLGDSGIYLMGIILSISSPPPVVLYLPIYFLANFFNLGPMVFNLLVSTARCDV